MAGETVKSEAICLSISPWSRTSHVVSWLTPSGRIGTVVKGAERPKSAFLGQYDLNYTCEVVYYARAKGDLHALRECTPQNRRDPLRDDYAALALAGYCRFLAERFAPQGPECAAWYGMLEGALDACAADARRSAGGAGRIVELLRYEIAVLHLLGLAPEIEADAGAFVLRGERKIPVSPAVASFLRSLSSAETRPAPERLRTDFQTCALDAARAVGVYYAFHVDGVSDVRRVVFRLIQNITRE